MGVKSPYEQIKDRNVEKKINKLLMNNTILNDYDKLILGLPIDKKLYKELNNNLLSNDIPNDIKSYILKKSENLYKFKGN